MNAAAWTTLLVTFAIAITVPGPDTFLLLRLGVRQRRAALLAACGIMTGNAVWTISSVLGLAALMRALPGALPALQVLGSAVLIWMGAQSIRSGVRALAESRARVAKDRTPLTATTAVKAGRAAAEVKVPAPVLAPPSTVVDHPMRLGMITNLSNPKALLFFAALFSQILPPDAGWLDRAEIVLVLTAVGLAWFLSFAVLTSSRAFQRWFGRATPHIDLAAGGVFILVAVVILIELGVAWIA